MKDITPKQFLAAHARLTELCKATKTPKLCAPGDIPAISSSKANRVLFTVMPDVGRDLTILFTYAREHIPPVDLTISVLAVLNLSIKVTDKGCTAPHVWTVGMKEVSKDTAPEIITEHISKEIVGCIEWFDSLVAEANTAASSTSRQGW